MMTDAEIKAEAARRYASMTEEQKRNIVISLNRYSRSLIRPKKTGSAR